MDIAVERSTALKITFDDAPYHLSVSHGPHSLFEWDSYYYPNWFHRAMHRIFFGVVWSKKGDKRCRDT